MGFKSYFNILVKVRWFRNFVDALGYELGVWRESLSQLLDIEDEQGSRFSRRSLRSTKTGNDPLPSHKSAPRLAIHTLHDLIQRLATRDLRPRQAGPNPSSWSLFQSSQQTKRTLRGHLWFRGGRGPELSQVCKKALWLVLQYWQFVINFKVC